MSAQPTRFAAGRLALPAPLPPTRWLQGNPGAAQITADIATPTEGRPGKGWWLCFGVALLALGTLGVMVAYLFAEGIGVWGLNNSVGWAFDITSFVFWGGISHGGALIAAVLLLFRQPWRASINRSAAAMTVFAVMCASLFPLIHMGRPWDAFFVFPYFPNQRGPLWVNFRSPLVWDVFALNTYLPVALSFWYLAMLPDLATLRDRSRTGVKRFVLGALSLGWNGSHRTWARYQVAGLVLAGLVTPMVAMHSIVSASFATSLLPGWHSTILPAYFLAGAVYSGAGMLLTLLIITRRTMRLQRYITRNHLEAMAKVALLAGSLVSYACASEFFSAWFSGNLYQRYQFISRATGPYAWCFYLMLLGNVVTSQALWWKRARRNVAVLFIASILINVGMWFERFVIIVVSQHRTFLPSAWGMFHPTGADVGVLVGGFGLFFTLFLLFIRFLPAIGMWEVKRLAAESRHDD